jgi:hypothetical protein
MNERGRKLDENQSTLFLCGFLGGVGILPAAFIRNIPTGTATPTAID